MNWLERNNRTFGDGVESSIEDIWDELRFWVAIWLSNVKESKDFLFSDLTRGWHFLL